ncbi:hypothetical protein M407DRAFT_28020 [Tulasnella calospora MUT 4182]|uniref:K Homology domain-containing protein n=1 Tax=Tulasnella calospora MUT 4182 TaxID=1051891 RepID=A0A0C3KM64_9AGAM|nr:hypothetical protein M407DRAFT_28020 [Tulasnella calospora MUT 4182]
MLRAASKSLARYSTIRRRPVYLNGLRLYSVDSSNHTPEAITSEDTQEPGPSDAAPPNSNDENSLTQSGKKTRRTRKLKPTGPPIQEQIISGSSFTQIQMESTSSEPTLDDLLALKPATLPDATRFGYPERYKKIYDKTLRIINRSFTEDQIHTFLAQLNPEIQSLPRTKSASISFLVQNNWNMSPPQGVSPKDRKPKPEEIILNPERLVVLLGKNGEGLRALATQLKVKIRPLPKRFGIEVTGRPEQITAVRSHLNQLRRRTTRRSVDLPLQSGVRHDLLQEISKRSGAYVQLEGAEKIEVSADSVAKHQRAARLINRACFDEADAKQIPLLINSNASLSPSAAEPDASAESYAAFPFLPSQTLPWTAGQPAFRVRRVGGLLSTAEESNSSDSSLQVWSGEGTQQNIKSVLLDGLPPLPKGYIRRIEGRTGHVLTSNRQSTGLFPPAPASENSLISFKEMVDQDTRTFVHSTSPSEIRSTSSQPKYRLVYQGGLSPMKIEGPPSIPRLRSQFVVEFTQPDGNAIAMKSRLGTLSRVDLACPDRALDMSFTAFDYKVLLLEDVPQSLKRFARKLPESFEKPEEIPPPDGLSSIVLGDTTYYLQSSSLVQVDTSVHEGDSREFTERTTDLDSRVTTASTLVKCVGLDTDAGWKTFVEQCNRAVTRPFYRPQAKFVPYRPTLVDE